MTPDIKKESLNGDFENKIREQQTEDKGLVDTDGERSPGFVDLHEQTPTTEAIIRITTHF